jgi:hypothetical protein
VGRSSVVVDKHDQTLVRMRKYDFQPDNNEAGFSPRRSWAPGFEENTNPNEMGESCVIGLHQRLPPPTNGDCR